MYGRSSQCLAPLFYHRVGAITVEDGGIKLIRVMQGQDSGFKKGLISAIV